MLNHPTKKHENDPIPVHPGDLVRLAGLDWIGHKMMGHLGLVLEVYDDTYIHARICTVIIDAHILRINEDDLIVMSRACEDERGTI